MAKSIPITPGCCSANAKSRPGILAAGMDPIVDEAYDIISTNIGRNDAEITRVLKEISPFILENAWGVWLPMEHRFSVWWPWLKNYYGVGNMGYNAQGHHRTFVWVDEDLKKLGY